MEKFIEKLPIFSVQIPKKIKVLKFSKVEDLMKNLFKEPG